LLRMHRVAKIVARLNQAISDDDNSRDRPRVVGGRAAWKRQPPARVRLAVIRRYARCNECGQNPRDS
jgi:hypothetical protein